MAPLVLPLADLLPEARPLVGGKAAALGALLRAGFPVPPGFCLTTAAFAEALAPARDDLAAILADVRPGDSAIAVAAAEACAERLAALAVPPSVAAAIRVALVELGLADLPLAVRSSATAEDRGDVSFAGQYETILGVRGPEGVLAAVLDCWRSFYCANAIAARATAGATSLDEAMALVVQRVVDAECAGVAFSVDPVRQSRATIVVDAVWGLGAGAVDGSVEADTYRVDRATFDSDGRRVVEKRRAVRLGPAGATTEPVDESLGRAACLPDPWLRRVAQFALAAEQAFGRPQDVEWAIAEGKLWLLQSRPITTLPAELSTAAPFPVDWPSDGHRLSHWEREWWIGPVPRLPLDVDAAESFSRSWRESALLKGEELVMEFALFNGRRYHRMVPSDQPEGDRRVRSAAHRDLAVRVTAGGASMWDFYAPEVVAATGRLGAVEPAALDDAALAGHVEDAFGAHLRHWVVHWCMALLNGVGLTGGAFTAEVAAATGLPRPEAELLALRLSDGDETAFTRLVAGLHDLAAAARAHPRVAALVADPPPDVADRLAALPEAADFRARLAELLRVYGDHNGAGFGSGASLARPSWRDDLPLVLRTAAPYVDPAVEAPSAARERALAARDALVEEVCAGCSPEAAAALRRALPAARRQRLGLEDHNHYIDQMSWGQLRRAVLAAGARLAARGALAAAEDVLWLRRPEVARALGAPEGADWRALVRARQSEHAAWCAQEAPLHLGMPSAALPPRPPFRDEVTVAAAGGGDRLVGIGASPGRHRGRARVVAMGTVLPEVAPGDVLVAVNAGPLWTPVFPMLGGLVLDQGAPLLHAATTAREFGVPAVLQTGDGSRRIADGAWVVVDGSAGTVELVGPERSEGSTPL
jgi:pyruvate,water dikinase